MDESTQVATALRIAEQLIQAGIPVFSAPPCPSGPFVTRDFACTRPGHNGGGVDYDLPAKWEQTVPARVWLDRWEPGWALAAVSGHAADFLDEDPRNGGEASIEELMASGQMPRVFGVQATASGGRHYLISPARERKIVGLLPGLDYQGGDASGRGRGFVWIAPTVRVSRVDGALTSYVWTQEPDLDYLAEFIDDDSLDGLRLRIAGWRAGQGRAMAERRSAIGSAGRTFTGMQMYSFLSPVLQRVRDAQIGEIEERANEAACALSHFVPSMLTEDAAFDQLTDALGATAYDPGRPGAGWDAEKFRAVIADIGGRAPGDWHAVRVLDDVASAVADVAVAGDEVSALLAEMLTADDLAEREPPRYMIDGLLQFDSESWVIGEPGARKSFVVLDMAAHVATGQPWQGRAVNPAVVVFVVAEGAGGSAARIRAWQKEYGAMGDAIRFLPRPVQAAKLADWAVLVRACERLADAAKGQGKGLLVVLDTQARVTVGLKENDATDMGVFIDAVAAIREASGACVLTVHHTGRRGGDARGSSAIDGAQTTELKVRTLHGLYGELITEKQKDIVEADPIKLKFRVVDLGVSADGRPVDSLVVERWNAWNVAEVDGGTFAALDVETARVVTPWMVRSEPESWTYARTFRSASLQRWLLQALADVAEEQGLTQAEWRRVVEEKTGKLDNSSWTKAHQKVVSSQFDGLVIKIQGAARWVIDPVQRVAEENVTEG